MTMIYSKAMANWMSPRRLRPFVLMIAWEGDDVSLWGETNWKCFMHIIGTLQDAWGLETRKTEQSEGRRCERAHVPLKAASSFLLPASWIFPGYPSVWLGNPPAPILSVVNDPHCYCIKLKAAAWHCGPGCFYGEIIMGLNCKRDEP